MAIRETQLDNAIEVVTPENIAFRYHVAGPFRRLLAYVVDCFIQFLIVVAFAMTVLRLMVAVGLYGFGLAGMFLLIFLLSWAYGAVLETYWNGQTIGKRAVGIRVLSSDGRPISAMQAVLRNVLRVVDALPVFWLVLPWEIGLIPLPTYLFGMVVMCATARFQRLGDVACGTMVVTEQRSWLTGLVRIEEPAALELAASLPASLEISRTLRQALSNYVERRRYFPASRRADIARHVGLPLVARLGLPPDTSHDLLLCALYHRAFHADDDRPTSPLEATVVGPAPVAPWQNEALPTIKT